MGFMLAGAFEILFLFFNFYVDMPYDLSQMG